MKRGSRLFSALILGLSACSQPSVLVDIGTWPDQAESLSVAGAVNGAPFSRPLSFPFGTTRFIVDLPDGKMGQLSLNLSAQDRFGCPRATAQAQVEVSRQLQPLVETAVTLTPSAAPYCPTLQLTGVTPASALQTAPTAITLSGSGFLNGATVTVGGAACNDVVVESAQKITCLLPAKSGSCGPQSVIVKNPDPDNQIVMGKLFSRRPTQVLFTSVTNLTGTGMAQKQSVAADFNGDGKPDLATCAYNSNNVSLYLNQGAGAFGSATMLAVGTNPGSLAVADLNGDGKLDLLTANASNSLSFLAGDGTGGFAAYVNPSPGATFNTPQAVVLGDFDEDGKQDAAVSNAFSSLVTILKGDGNGKLLALPSVTVGNSPRYLAVADLNRDGHLDLVTPNQSDDTVSFRPGVGNGTFGPGVNIQIEVDLIAAAVADVDNDQKLDILVTNQRSNFVAVLLGDGAGGFSSAPGSPFLVGGSTPQLLSVADFNLDGIPDVATANYGANTVSILLGDGQGRLTPTSNSPYAQPGTPTGVLAVDLNGDGLSDLVTANQGGHTTAVRLALCN